MDRIFSKLRNDLNFLKREYGAVVFHLLFSLKCVVTLENKFGYRVKCYWETELNSTQKSN